MMRQNGLVERWREMARSAEAMRQMHSLPEMASVFALHAVAPPEPWSRRLYPFLQVCDRRHWYLPHAEPPAQPRDTDRLARLNRHIDMLQDRVGRLGPAAETADEARSDSGKNTKPRSEFNEHDCKLRDKFRSVHDVPDETREDELFLLYLVETDFAEFSDALLQYILLPHWRHNRAEFVESEADRPVIIQARRSPQEEETASSQEWNRNAGSVRSEHVVHLAEEFLAIRYLSLMRAVLVNVRHLMTWIATAFVLCIVSWNSYPFRPRAWVDAALTTILLILGGGVIWVLAQIHRDPILSRITRTRPNELGADFFLRVAGVGALPVLTWMAYQFPSISDSILRYLQPGVEATLK